MGTSAETEEPEPRSDRGELRLKLPLEHRALSSPALGRKAPRSALVLVCRCPLELLLGSLGHLPGIEGKRV